MSMFWTARTSSEQISWFNLFWTASLHLRSPTSCSSRIVDLEATCLSGRRHAGVRHRAEQHDIWSGVILTPTTSPGWQAIFDSTDGSWWILGATYPLLKQNIIEAVRRVRHKTSAVITWLPQGAGHELWIEQHVRVFRCFSSSFWSERSGWILGMILLILEMCFSFPSGLILVSGIFRTSRNSGRKWLHFLKKLKVDHFTQDEGFWILSFPGHWDIQTN